MAILLGAEEVKTLRAFIITTQLENIDLLLMLGYNQEK